MIAANRSNSLQIESKNTCRSFYGNQTDRGKREVAPRSPCVRKGTEGGSVSATTRRESLLCGCSLGSLCFDHATRPIVTSPILRSYSEIASDERESRSVCCEFCELRLEYSFGDDDQPEMEEAAMEAGGWIRFDGGVVCRHCKKGCER